MRMNDLCTEIFAFWEMYTFTSIKCFREMVHEASAQTGVLEICCDIQPCPKAQLSWLGSESKETCSFLCPSPLSISLPDLRESSHSLWSTED
jgi:hypothetical protein